MRRVGLACSALVSLFMLMLPITAFATLNPGCYDIQAGDGKYHQQPCTGDLATDVNDNGTCYSRTVIPRQAPASYAKVDCNSVEDSRVDREELPNGSQLNPAGECDSDSGNCIADDIQLVINVLAVGVGIVVTGMIVVGGLQYMLARDNAQAVQAAKSKILNAVIGLVAFIFVYAFLQWIVPGGLF